MIPLRDAHRAEITALCRRFLVRRLEVFDPAARGADLDPARSNVDLLVTYDPDVTHPGLGAYFELHERLEAVLGRRVDPVTAGTVENPVTAQVSGGGQTARRSAIGRSGSAFSACRISQPCVLAVESTDRTTAKALAPLSRRKPPEISCRTLDPLRGSSTGASCSARLLVNGTRCGRRSRQPLYAA